MRLDLPIGVARDTINAALASFGFDPKDIAAFTMEWGEITAVLYIRDESGRSVVVSNERATVTVRIPVTNKQGGGG